MDRATQGIATRRVRDLPAPPGVPLLGNLLQLDRARLHLTAEKWRRQYGDFYRFRNGPREIVVIADPDTIASSCATGLRDSAARVAREHRARDALPGRVLGLEMRLRNIVRATP